MIRRFLRWLMGSFRRSVPASTEPMRMPGSEVAAKSANICLARRTSMKHERENAYRTLRIMDADLRYLRGD